VVYLTDEEDAMPRHLRIHACSLVGGRFLTAALFVVLPSDWNRKRTPAEKKQVLS
jgi:hypothetical protein